MIETKILDEIEELEITGGDLIVTAGDIDLVHIDKKLKLPIKNDATAPTLSFGDGDSGFYEIADDEIGLSLAGVLKWQTEGCCFLGSNANGPNIINEAASSSNPTLTPNRTDNDTGIGHASGDQLSLIAGGVEGHRITEAAGVIVHILAGTLNDIALGAAQHIVLPLHNDAVTPTLAFGDGDTGFYEFADDALYVSIAGTPRWRYATDAFYSYLSAGPMMKNISATATEPGFRFQSDEDTGIGRSGADALSLIAGGVEGQRIIEATTITNQLNGRIVTPTTQTLPGAGAADVVSSITILPSDAYAITLADGVVGQHKYIIEDAGFGNDVLTPANLAGGTTITFQQEGSCHLLFINSKWHYMGGDDAVLA